MKNKLAILICIISQAFNSVSYCQADHHPSSQSELSNNNSAASILFPDWIRTTDPSNFCRGYYQPLFNMEPNIESGQYIKLQADKTLYRPKGPSELIGDVQVNFANHLLKANHVLVYSSQKDKQLEKIVVKGQSYYLSPDITLQGKNAYWDNIQENLILQDAHYRFYPQHASGVASEIKYEHEDKLRLRNASYTTCSPLSPSWTLEADKIVLDKSEGKGNARHITLNVKHVPVFYWPYLTFPLDDKRHSGFLFPNLTSTSNSGIELSIPYYWNIAPNYDLTFTPRILTRRGVDLQTQFRYLTPKSQGHIQFNFLPDDNSYQEFRRTNRQFLPANVLPNDPRVQALEDGSHRVGLNIYHQTYFTPHWQGGIDISYVGDDNYFIDLGNDIHTASTTKLLQQGQILYSGAHWNHEFRVQEFQVLYPFNGPSSEEDYKRQPQWAFHGYYPLNYLGFSYELQGELVNFTHRRDAFSGLKPTEGQRYHLKPGLSYPLITSYSFFTPRIQWDFLAYDLDLSAADLLSQKPKSPSRSIPIVDIDTGLYFDRYSFYHQREYLHTFEPRVYYLYVPFRDQRLYPNFDSGLIDFGYSQLFRDNRFSGRDRLGDTHQVTLSATSRLLDKSNRQEALRASIGQIIYFEKRNVTLCENDAMLPQCRYFEDQTLNKHFSDVIFDLKYWPKLNWYASTGLEISPNNGKTNKAYFNFQYQPESRKLLNLSYYWIRVDPAQTNLTTGIMNGLQQTDASIIWPVLDHVDIISQWRYDLERSRTITMLGGIEYDSCCFAFQLVGSRYLIPNDGFSDAEYTNGIFFQIMLKGLSSVGFNSAERKMREAIPGYPGFSTKNRFD